MRGRREAAGDQSAAVTEAAEHPARVAQGVWLRQPAGKADDQGATSNLARHLAAPHRLASLRLFGSAARTDFRPDIDIDIAIRYRSGVEPNLRSLREIEQAPERATGRDVEVPDGASLDPDVLERVEREAVSLL